MSRYLLDTNILSHATKPVPSESLTEWLTEQDDEDLFTSSLSVAEIWRGVLLKSAGKKRRELEDWFNGHDGPLKQFAGRILPFDQKAGLIWGRLMSEGVQIGRPRNPLDMILAAVAEANGCIVVTDNEKDFHGIRILNPVR